MKEVASQPLFPGKPLGFTVIRVPFFLEPEYPEDENFGETNRERLIRKWGGVEGWELQKKRHKLKERGIEAGIQRFDLDRIASNTLKSHRLIQWATKTHGINVSETLYDNLNFRHFQEGQKLNSTAMLCDAAASVGIDRQSAESFLRSTAGLSEIRAAQVILQRAGITGIPTFVLGGQRLASGALAQADLVRLLRECESRGGGSSALFAAALGIPAAVMEETLNLDRPLPHFPHLSNDPAAAPCSSREDAARAGR